MIAGLLELLHQYAFGVKIPIGDGVLFSVTWYLRFSV